MNVLYILSDSVMGGATHSALSLIEAMQSHSCDVIVLSPNMNKDLRDRLDRNEIRWEVLRFGFDIYPSIYAGIIKWPISLFKSIIINKLAIRRIVKIINDNKIDIVHTNVGPVTCGFYAAKKVGIPHVWHIREYGDKDFNIRMFPSQDVFRSMLREGNVILITNNLKTYNKLDKYSNARVIYNGVRKRSETQLSSNKEKYFLCASRVSPEKGFEQIIRVFAKFHEYNPDYSLKIIGLYNERYLSKIMKQAKSLNVESSVYIEGYKNNVSEYMSKARALLVASPNEGFGRMTAEAAFAGCLVIGKNTAGTREIMEITGGYPFMSDDEMLNAMIAVSDLTEKEYLEKASYAQIQAVTHFSEESYVDQVLCFYKTILESSNRGVSL